MAETVKARRRAATCRWAVATLFLPAPIWFESENAPWTCQRDSAPRVLSTTDVCAICHRWQPRPSGALAEMLDQDTGGTTHPSMPDWFGAFPQPHETEPGSRDGDLLASLGDGSPLSRRRFNP